MITLKPLSVEYKITRYPEPTLAFDRWLIECDLGLDDWKTVTVRIWVDAKIEDHRVVISSITCTHDWFVVEPDRDWVQRALDEWVEFYEEAHK